MKQSLLAHTTRGPPSLWDQLVETLRCFRDLAEPASGRPDCSPGKVPLGMYAGTR